MNYTIKRFIAETEEFRIEFDDGRWINIDLVNDFPNYHIIYNNFGDPFWFYISQNGEKTIKKLNVLDIRKKSSKYNNTYVDDVPFKIASQTDYDKYCNNDENNKLYKLLDRLWNGNENIVVSMV